MGCAEAGPLDADQAREDQISKAAALHGAAVRPRGCVQVQCLGLHGTFLGANREAPTASPTLSSQQQRGIGSRAIGVLLLYSAAPSVADAGERAWEVEVRPAALFPSATPDLIVLTGVARARAKVPHPGSGPRRSCHLRAPRAVGRCH